MEEMIQKNSNEMISMKSKMGKPTPSFQKPYQVISKRQYNGKALQLPPSQKNLSIEVAPKK